MTLPTGPWHRTSSRRSAFTLIELVFVILLIMLFIGFAVPRFNEMTTINLRSASRQLSALIKFTYNRAVMQRKRFRLVINMADGTYWLEEHIPFTPPPPKEDEQDYALTESEEEEFKKQRRGHFEKISRYLAKPGKLPSGIVVERFFDVRTKNEQKEGYLYLYFYPEGEATGGYLVLATKEEVRITLKINPITAEVKSIRGEVDAAG